MLNNLNIVYDTFVGENWEKYKITHYFDKASLYLTLWCLQEMLMV